MPKKKFVNENVEQLSEVLPLVARGSRVLPIQQVHSSNLVKVVIDTINKYPDTMRPTIGTAQIATSRWILDTRDEIIINAIFLNRVALTIAGYTLHFFLEEELVKEDDN